MESGRAIDLSTQEEGEVAIFVKERRDMQQIPEGVAIFFVIEKQLDCGVIVLD